MCLSTAYAGEKSADRILAKNVTAIAVDGGCVVLTNLMDEEIRVAGRLVSADLVNGAVIIETEDIAD